MKKKKKERKNGSDITNTLNIAFHRETRTQDSQREPKTEKEAGTK